MSCDRNKPAAKATMDDGGSAIVAGNQQKPPSHGSARFERILSGLGAAPLVDVEPEKVKDEIRRWAKKVAALVRRLSFGGLMEPQRASDDAR